MASTRKEIVAEVLGRMGSYQLIQVAVDPDVTDSAAQRKVITSDTYSIDNTTPHLGQANLWASRIGQGSKVRKNSYIAVSKAILTEPTAGTYTLRVYGYGTTATLTPGDAHAAAIQTAIRNVSASLTSVTVSGTVSPYTINLPSASITIELVATNGTGSITQGLSSFEAIRPWSSALLQGDEIILSTKYPLHDDIGPQGLNTLINQALERLWFVDTLHFTSTAADSDQKIFTLNETYPWLSSRGQIIRAYAPTRWRHTFSFTVPGVSWSVLMEIPDAVTSNTLSASASASAIETSIQTLFSTSQLQGTVSVEASSITRTVTIDHSPYADMVLTLSNDGSVTTTHERMESLRWCDGWRLKYHGTQFVIEWDETWQRGETWFLEVLRPGYTKVIRQVFVDDALARGSEWIDTTTGLEDDLDQCKIDKLEVAAMAHFLACRQMVLYGPAQESSFWKDQLQKAAGVAARITSLDLPTSSDPGFSDDGLRAIRGSESKGFFS